MTKKGVIRPNEFLALIIIFVGSLGFGLWGLGVGLTNLTLIWIGQVIVGVVIVVATFLSRWLR